MPKSNLLASVKELSIVTKELEVVKFGDVMNYAQIQLVREVERRLDLGIPIRIIVLKARQIGISTAVEAILFVLAFSIKRFRGMVIAHELDSSEHILGMTETYWDTYPYKLLYTEKYRGRKHLAWKETMSMLRIQTANNTKAGRSQTIQGLHASEVAFWEKPSELMTGLSKSVPKTPLSFIFLESTANGVGNFFHQQWLMAEAGTTSYTPLFFPWWKHPEYRMKVYKPLGRLDEEERVLRDFFIEQGMDPVELVERLNWRRFTIPDECNNDVNQFHQEYPTTPEEAFLSTGHNVFPAKHAKDCYKPKNGIKGRLVNENGTVRFQADSYGPLEIFSYPSKDTDWGQYVVAGDPTRTIHGDFAVAQVLNRRTLEQCAELRIRCDPNTFGYRLMDLARYFNMALINLDITGPGYATVATIIHNNYPHLWQRQQADQQDGTFLSRFGWDTTVKTKPEAIGNMIKVIVDHELVFHSSQLFHEVLNYVDLGGGQYGNSIEGEYDDCVTSMAIGITTVLYEAVSLQAYGEQTSRGNELRISEVVEEREPVWATWGEDS